MANFRSLTPACFALLAIELVLLSLFISAVWHGTDAPRLLATPDIRPPVFQPVLERPPLVQDFDGLQANALFYVSRRYFVPPVFETAPLAKPDYRLTGTFVAPNKQAIALLSGPAGASKKVAVGDLLDGWTVSKVDARSVELRHGSETYELSSSRVSAGIGVQAIPPLSPEAQVPRAAVSSAPVPGATVRQLGSVGISRVHLSASVHEPHITPRLYHAPPR